MDRLRNLCHAPVIGNFASSYQKTLKEDPGSICADTKEGIDL